MTFDLSDLAEGDLSGWRPLWDGYCAFYKTDVPPWVTARTWQRLMDPQVAMWGRVVRHHGRIVGFTHFLTHPSTWATESVCYLEDLFVAPDARGIGAGRALIDDVLRFCERRGWAELYWMTAETNAEARKLYDVYEKADGMIRYRLKL